MNHHHAPRDEETASERSCASVYNDHSVVSEGSHELAYNSAHFGKRSVFRLMLIVGTVVILVVVGAAIVGSIAKSSTQQQTQFSTSSSLNTTSGCDDFHSSPRDGHHGRHHGEHSEPHNKTSGCIDSDGWGDHGGPLQNRTGNETADGGGKNCDGDNTSFHNASDSED